MPASSDIRRLRRVVRHALTAPLFARRLAGTKAATLSTVEDFQNAIAPLSLDDLAAVRAQRRDPYGGRRSENGAPCLVMQMEYDPPLYLGFGRGELRTYAEALTRCWRLLGIGAGDRVALYDYGTSPAVYLASAAFAPHLSRGAADALGCVPICNDGLPEMASRAVHILRYTRPRVLFIRHDALRPLVDRLSGENTALRFFGTQAVVVTGNEEAFGRGSMSPIAEQLGVPLYGLLRADAALFLAPQCPRGGRWHGWPDLYFLEVLDEETFRPLPGGRTGFLTITPLFARTCPLLRYVTTITAALDPDGCPCGEGGVGIVLP